MTSEATTVEASKKIPAEASEIFGVLTDPKRHLEIDGSGMLRGSLSDQPVTAVGDVFSMRMYHENFGDYVMKNTVVELEPNRRIAWEPARVGLDAEPWHYRWGFALEPEGDSTVVTEFFDLSSSPEVARSVTKGGTIWLEAMTKTLERLERRFASRSAEEVGPAGAGERAIGAVTLFAEDLAAARAFYEKLTARGPIFEDANSAVFELGTVLVNLLDTAAAHDLIAPARVAPAESGARQQLTIFVEDVDATVTELSARGVTFLNGPLDRPWGMRTACFADPAGHLWEVAATLGRGAVDAGS